MSSPVLGKRARDADSVNTTDLQPNNKKQKTALVITDESKIDDESKTDEFKTNLVTADESKVDFLVDDDAKTEIMMDDESKDESSATKVTLLAKGSWSYADHSLKDETLSTKPGQRRATFKYVGGLLKANYTWSFDYGKKMFDWGPFFYQKSLCRFWFRDVSNVVQLKEVEVEECHENETTKHMESVVEFTIESDDDIFFKFSLLTKHPVTGQTTMFHSNDKCSPDGMKRFPDCIKDNNTKKDDDAACIRLANFHKWKTIAQ